MFTYTYSRKDQPLSSGAVSGPPSGAVSGPPSGAVSGPPTGPPTGPPSGLPAQLGKQFNKSSSGGTATHLHKDLNTYAKKPPVKALSEG